MTDSIATPSLTPSAPDPSEWYKTRSYLHFDRPVSQGTAARIASDPNRVSRHAFYPFLTYEMAVSRYLRAEHRNTEKLRPICYAAHMDAHIYAYYAAILGSAYEARLAGGSRQLAEAVLAYRKLGRSNINFAMEAFEDINTLTSELGHSVAMAFDVSAFFDSLNHELLKEAWQSTIGASRLPSDHYQIYRSLTLFSTVDRKTVLREFEISFGRGEPRRPRICSPQEFRERVRGKGLVRRNPNNFGIPQGSPLSAVLSNVYMLEFDEKMTGLARATGGVYRRYCDDILWIAPADKAEEIQQHVSDCLLAAKLSENRAKREVVAFSRTGDRISCAGRPLQYLGFVYDGCRVLIRSQTIARYFRRMKSGVYGAFRAAKRAGGQEIFRRKLYEKYSHLGRRNFLSYVRLSHRLSGSDPVRQQMSRHWEKLNRAIDKRESDL